MEESVFVILQRITRQINVNSVRGLLWCDIHVCSPTIAPVHILQCSKCRVELGGLCKHEQTLMEWHLELGHHSQNLRLSSEEEVFFNDLLTWLHHSQTATLYAFFVPCNAHILCLFSSKSYRYFVWKILLVRRNLISRIRFEASFCPDEKLEIQLCCC